MFCFLSFLPSSPPPSYSFFFFFFFVVYFLLFFFFLIFFSSNLHFSSTSEYFSISVLKLMVLFSFVRRLSAHFLRTKNFFHVSAIFVFAILCVLTFIYSNQSVRNSTTQTLKFIPSAYERPLSQRAKVSSISTPLLLSCPRYFTLFLQQTRFNRSVLRKPLSKETVSFSGRYAPSKIILTPKIC